MTTAETNTIQPDEIREGAIRPSPICPTPVAFSVMAHGWWNLTFLHWRVPAESVQRLLPPGLTVETFDGSAWVALVPFEMQVTLPHAPPVPWLSSFPETNVRTYVRGPDGTTGVWFFSLEAARLGAVVTARVGYSLPYFWSRMAVDRIGPVVTYRTRRLGPSPRGVRSELAIEVGEPYAPDELGDLDHWLTARWRLYSATAGGLRSAQADHPPLDAAPRRGAPPRRRAGAGRGPRAGRRPDRALVARRARAHLAAAPRRARPPQLNRPATQLNRPAPDPTRRGQAVSSARRWRQYSTATGTSESTMMAAMIGSR